MSQSPESRRNNLPNRSQNNVMAQALATLMQVIGNIQLASVNRPKK